MKTVDQQLLLQALCALGLALAEKGHIWTPEQRRFFERAVRIVEAEQPYDPLKLSINAEGRVVATV